ncbi:hypothetical protein HSR122_1754 [Halapricum desulfuricans]|uniref:Uncharacterized protein n=1 Tax=Halapricum desulfuricans TaxID=2841257 RepID=A0A897N9J7_9EURY|nr:hypothetical protein HSR122_1754 [Halapricum desulfuricans]
MRRLFNGHTTPPASRSSGRARVPIRGLCSPAVVVAWSWILQFCADQTVCPTSRHRGT